MQSARRGDVPAPQALQEIEHTIDTATELKADVIETRRGFGYIVPAQTA